jgi:hypothetical protein
VPRHDPAASGRQPQQRLGVHHPGPVQGRDLAEAVAEGHLGRQAETRQRTQRSGGVGNDPWLGESGQAHVTARRQPCSGVHRTGLGEPAAERATAGATARALAREEEADPAGAEHLPEETAMVGVEQRGLPSVQSGHDTAQPPFGVLGRGHDDGGPVREVVQLGLKGGRQVGQLGVRKLGYEVGHPRHPIAQLLR